MGNLRKFISRDKLLEYLDCEVDYMSDSFGVYSIESQVQEGGNYPNKYLGYKMQFVESPCLVLANLEESDVNEEKIELQTIITEFLGLMNQTRYLIGISLLHKELKKGTFFPEENQNFEVHYNNSIILLSIASDRIRKFLIVGVLKEKNPRKYYRESYHYPFEKSVSFLRDYHNKFKFKNITDELVDKFFHEILFVSDNARKISEFRRERNCMIHGLFTKEAALDKQLLINKHNSPLIKNKRTRIYMENQLAENRKNIIENIESSMNKLKNWYLLLVDLGNLVFQAEYMVRK